MTAWFSVQTSSNGVRTVDLWGQIDSPAVYSVQRLRPAMYSETSVRRPDSMPNFNGRSSTAAFLEPDSYTFYGSYQSLQFVIPVSSRNTLSYGFVFWSEIIVVVFFFVLHTPMGFHKLPVKGLAISGAGSWLGISGYNISLWKIKKRMRKQPSQEPPHWWRSLYFLFRSLFPNQRRF